ncbi:MAG TPA: glycosyltransferase [Ktedonobacterales bacterium]|nr:glycosyltransferase [Ktedonobacterales bacterium]
MRPNVVDETIESQATPAPSPGIEVAYLLKRYPRLSETFILHEMLALEELGLRLRVYSMMDPHERTTHPDVRRLQAVVTYLPGVTVRTIGRFAGAHLCLARRDPHRYLLALRRALSRHDPLAGLRHFLRGGWLAIELEQRGIRHLHAHFAHGPAATAHFAHLLTDLSFSFTGHAKDIYTTPPERIAERIRDAQFVVTCTSHNVEFLARLVDSATAPRIHCIYHGVDLRRFQPGPHPVSDVPMILAVGRLVEKKGLSYLIDACALLRDRGMLFRCHIVGSGPLKTALRDQIAARGLRDAVQLVDACTQEQLVEVYRAATVVTLPCVVLENGDRDGIPNVLVEAMSMGIPVISTRISGIPELIADGENGLLVPPRDAAALADALAGVLADAGLRRRLGDAAHDTVMERFNLHHNARRLETLYGDVLSDVSHASLKRSASLVQTTP